MKAVGARDSIVDRRSARNGWRGIILVANTPFGDNGSVDFDSIPAFADYIADAGCEAALLRGVAAETVYLDLSERSRLVQSFADATRGRFRPDRRLVGHRSH